MVEHARGAVLELAHALVDQAGEIGQAVWHRRVDGEAGALGVDGLGGQPVGRAAVLGVHALRERDDFGEDFDFLVDAGRPLKKTSTISSKLNSQNGSLTLRGVSTSALSPKKRPYSLWASTRKMRRSGRDFRSSCRMIATPRGLADAGGAEHGEMLADHFGAVDVAADAGVLLQVPDIDRARAGHLVDDAQLGIGHHGDAVADRRIVGDAALEAGAAGGVAHDLAHQVELRGRDRSPCPWRAGDVDRDVGDHADQERGAAVDGQELAHRGARVVGCAGLRRRKPMVACEPLTASTRPIGCVAWKPGDAGAGAASAMVRSA